MNKKFYETLLIAIFVVTMACIVFTGHASALIFKVEITNLSPNVLSPAALVTHNSGYDLFDAGALASSAVEAIAETGNNSLILSEAMLSSAVLDTQVPDGSILTQGMTGTAMINADPSHPLLTYAAMMGKSNDGWIGGSTGDGAIQLFSGSTPMSTDLIIMPFMVWDAGTEMNDELLTSVGAGIGTPTADPITANHPGIVIGGAGHLPLSVNWTGGPVAQLKVTPTPIPAPILLLGTGLLGMAGLRRKKSLKQ